MNSKPKKVFRDGAKINLTPKTTPALKELLDHLAYDLAQEYLRLMRKADEKGRHNRKGKTK